MERNILVASTNPGKLGEFSVMLGEWVRWVGLSDFGNVGEVEEDGVTFAENARKKAVEYSKACGLWTVADDSGLVVDALGGDPGVRSARFSGEKTEGKKKGLIDHRNMMKVLRLLEGVRCEERTARFVCNLCLADGDEVLIEVQGTLEGIIAERGIGENGFGYDPIFFVPKLEKTVAQLNAEEKNSISHRGNAIRKFRPLLLKLTGGQFENAKIKTKYTKSRYPPSADD